MTCVRGVPLPRITVLTETCRTQYMETQANALRLQTFTDFEWVLMDDNYGENKEWVASFVKVPLTHIPPREVKPYFATAAAINDALIYTRGELVIFLVDYVIPQPTCLEKQWEVYQKYPKSFISGSSIPLQDDGSMRAGKDYRQWLFEMGFFPRIQLEEGIWEVPREGVQNWWMGRNDSVPLEALLDINGLDEQFDGRWGGQDADVAQRLMTYGLKYLLTMKSVCLEFPHIHGAKPAIKTEKDQQGLQNIIDDKVKKGIYDSGMERSLREERRWRL